MLNKFIVFTLLFTTSYSKPKLAVPSPFFLTNASFTQYIIFEPHEKVKSCGLSFFKTESTELLYDILDLNKEVPYKYDSDIISLGRQLCGYKHLHYQKNKYINETFNLLAEYQEDGHHKTIDFTYKIGPYDKVVVTNLSHDFNLAEPASFYYGGSAAKQTLRLYNPKGELVSYKENPKASRNEFQIDYLTGDHIGTWIAELGVGYTMDPILQYIEIKAKSPEQVLQWYREENGYGIVGSRLENPIPEQKIQFCEFNGPNGLSINSDRYSRNGTDTYNNTCQVEFQLPLQENEVGYWKINMGNLTGAFIPVNQSKPPPFETNIERYVIIGSFYELICKVTYSADNCIIISPSGETYIGGTLKESLSLGECKIKLDSVHFDHIGTWNCIFSNPNSFDDDIIYFELKQNTTSSEN